MQHFRLLENIYGNLPQISAIVGTSLMGILLVALLLRYFLSVFAPDGKGNWFLSKKAFLSAEAEPSTWPKALLCSGIWLLASRVFIVAATLVYALSTNSVEDYIARFVDSWVKWDAPHYVGLIRNWYVNKGDAMYHIVFFPMYPMVCRVLLPLFFGNARASAFFVSNACALFAGAVLYRLVAGEYGEKTAGKSVRFCMLSPLSFFLSLPYTESMFLLLTLLSVYFARRRRFAWAVAVGACCAMCRLMGLVVAIPVFYEMLCADKGSESLSSKRTILRAFQCMLVLVGVGCYLLLNWEVTGNPFQFAIYQKEHWYNSMGTLWNTFSYIVHYAQWDDSAMRIATWGMTILMVYGAILLHLVRARKDNPGMLAYGWAYLYMSIVPTWLISGPRYIGGLYTLYPLLGSMADKWWKDMLLSLVSLALLAYVACMFLFYSAVY